MGFIGNIFKSALRVLNKGFSLFRRYLPLLVDSKFLVGFGLIIFLSFTTVFHHQKRLKAKKDLSPASSELVLNKFGAGNHKKDSSDLSQAILIDSIISVVQSYYVDSDRVKPESLLDVCIENLSLNPDIKIKKNKSRLIARVGDVEKEFSIAEEIDNQKLLSIFTGLSLLIDDNFSKNTLQKTLDQQQGSTMVLNAMLGALDAHSAILSPDSYKELKQGTEGAFGGLGLLVGIKNNLLTVVKPLPRSPALKAKIKKRDMILKIDSTYTYGQSLDKLISFMRGEPGSSVQLELLRSGENHPRTLDLKREMIALDSVTARDISEKNHDFLLLKIENFANRTSNEVLQAINNFRNKKKKPLDGLVLDLRSNPGGLLDQAVEVANLFLESGAIVTTKGRNQESESVTSGHHETKYPIIVLINSDSASASEIVAGALQDHGRAIVIGQPSFGKGSVQTVFELPAEQALKLTVARYYTPLGRSIQNTGIIPDIWLQPVWKFEKNENLMGNYRYKGEKFLKNHLETVKEPGLHLSAKEYIKPQKGYYLINSTEEEMEDTESSIDHDLKVTRTILSKLANTYGSKIPTFAQRSGHWLALASNEIKQELNQITSTVEKWLKEKFILDWRSSVTKHTDNLELKLNGIGSIESVMPQDEVEIPWEIYNPNPESISRVSVFALSSVFGTDIPEVLVGKIEPRSKISGATKFKVPGNAAPGFMNIIVNVAMDSEPSVKSSKNLVLRIIPKEEAKISFTSTLVNEAGATQNDVLEDSETAEVKLTIKNESPFEVTNIIAQLENLAGKQVEILKQKDEPVNIPPRSEKSINYPIKASKKIFSPELEFGVSIESKDLLEPVRKVVSIKTGTKLNLSH